MKCRIKILYVDFSGAFWGCVGAVGGGWVLFTYCLI